MLAAMLLTASLSSPLSVCPLKNIQPTLIPPIAIAALTRSASDASGSDSSSISSRSAP